MSHPTWVRGLKHIMAHNMIMMIVSHPTWVRGLKQRAYVHARTRRRVAPYVGAWIETREAEGSGTSFKVAPYVGAWIETIYTMRSSLRLRVAPYVGAWIETSLLQLLP